MAKRYIIVAPEASKSNGVRVLFNLSKELEKRGFEAYMFTWNSSELGFNIISNITNEMKENDIVIYPEIIKGNPLGFKNVVRWVLYYPGKLGGDAEFADNELIFAFFNIFYPTENILYIPSIDSDLFYCDDTPRVRDCYFVYKGGKWKDIPEFDNMLEINMKFPAKREDLANLLRTTKTLYSYDNCSSLLDEAIMCGCDVKIVTKDGFSDYKSEYIDIVENYDKKLESFIEKTQNFNWQGEIKSKKIKFSKFIYMQLKKILYKYIIKNEKKYNKYQFKLKSNDAFGD